MLKFNSFLFDRCFRLSPIRWRRVFEGPRVMISILKRIVLIIQDGLNKEMCIAVYLLTHSILRLVKKSGLLFTALYLKQCSSSLQTAYGGVKRPHGLLPVSIKLSRAGYPVIIPPFHRKMIRCRNDKSDMLVQFYLSAFAVFRLIELAKEVDKTTLKSIVSPLSDKCQAPAVCGEIKQVLTKVVTRYLSRISKIPLHQGMTWVPTWKALPTTGLINDIFGKQIAAMKLPNVDKISSCFVSYMFEMRDFAFLMERVHVSEDHVPQGLLWPKMTRYAFDSYNKILSGFSLEEFDSIVGPKLWSFREIGTPPICGRLGIKVEGGGKRRIFAIGNYINQRLLRPVHDWLMEVLRTLPMDGTFNQTAPLDRLVGSMSCYSFDLKSATDRWPLQILFELLVVLFDRSFASSVRSCLALNLFKVPFGTKRPSKFVSFVAGQPLGYYSSWPLFALSHHLVVWWCAEKVYPGQYFDRYAILGDDVVIADSRVAKEYETALERLDVMISYQKSLISDNGSAEFAKRMRVRGLSKDISPISPRCVLNFYHPFGLMALNCKYKIKRLSTLVRIGGGGFKTLGKLDHTSTSNRRVERIKVMSLKSLLSSGKLDWWLGRGRPISPYLRYHLKGIILEKMKPRDVDLPPEQLFVTEKVRDFLEYSMVRSWVDSWLRLLKWYVTMSLEPVSDLSVLFDAPYCTKAWRRTSEDLEMVRFGFIWSLYDIVGQMGSDWLGVILTEGTTDCRLVGGSSSTSFLVSGRGLIQPRSGSGVVLPGITICDSRFKDPRKTTIHYKTLGESDRQVVLGFYGK